MISRLIVLGATGDLAGRFLLPAVARLQASRQGGADLHVVGAAPQDLDDEAFARHVAGRLHEHAPDVPAEVREGLLRRLRFRRVDLDAPETVHQAVRASVAGDSGGAVAVYLALPPGLFPAALAALGAADLPTGSRIAVEKPFGSDLDSAVALNALLAQATRGAGEQAVFRVDHVLAMPAVQDLLRLRLPGGELEPVWSSAAVERVEVLWEETLALEGRADFFDRTGAVKDVVQNHLLQLLALVAMEPPPAPDESADERDLSDARLAALRAVRPPTTADAASRTRRARYTAGRLAGGAGVDVPDYAQEAGVDPARSTETFAELVLEVDTPRWAGTPFVLRAGKALAEDRKGVLLTFRDPLQLPDAPGARPTRQVWVGLDGPGPTDGAALEPAPLAVGVTAGGEAAAYVQVLTDLLTGSIARSVSGAEAEQAWRVVDPVLRAWAVGAVPLLDHAAGTRGPG